MTTPTAETRASLEETRAELARLKTENDDLRAQLARIGAAVPGAAGDAGDVMARAAHVLALPARFEPGETYRIGTRYGKIALMGDSWAACLCEDCGLLEWDDAMLTHDEADTMLRRFLVHGDRP